MLALLLLTEIISFCGCDFTYLHREQTLSRKRRYLHFPEGSVAVVRNFVKSRTYKWDRVFNYQLVRMRRACCAEYILRFSSLLLFFRHIFSFFCSKYIFLHICAAVINNPPGLSFFRYFLLPFLYFLFLSPFSLFSPVPPTHLITWF